MKEVCRLWPPRFRKAERGDLCESPGGWADRTQVAQGLSESDRNAIKFRGKEPSLISVQPRNPTGNGCSA